MSNQRKTIVKAYIFSQFVDFVVKMYGLTNRIKLFMFMFALAEAEEVRQNPQNDAVLENLNNFENETC